MINFPTNLVPAVMLQSLDEIRKLMESGQSLIPDYDSYWTGHGLLGDMIGMFAAVFLIIINTLGGWLGNYGVAIMLTAVFVRLVLFLSGLTTAQIRGMKNMQALQPVIKAIQYKYPDRNQQGIKQMDLYKKYKINPMSGCLPMLIQMPVLFGIYRALYDTCFAGHDFFGIQLLFPVNVTGVRSFGMGGADMVDVIDTVVSVDKLQHSMFELPAGIPLIGGSTWYLPALILVVFYVLTSFWMQKVMRDANQPDKEFEKEFLELMKIKDDRKDPSQDMAEQMQRSMKFMNFIVIIFAFIFSAGALLYFIVQNTIMVLEYKLLTGRSKIDFDLKELRTWINEPPQSMEQRQAEALSRISGKAGALEEKAGAGSTGKMDTTQADGAEVEEDGPVDPDNGSDDGDNASLKRPRKKRRKR